MGKLAWIAAAVFLGHVTPCAAQDSPFEFQAGGGYAMDSGEGPTVPAVITGLFLWPTSSFGVGFRFAGGIGDDHFNPPGDGGDRIFLGPGGLRMWQATAELRSFHHGFEVNLGLGWGNHSYEYSEILTGIRRTGDVIDPIVPRLSQQRYGTGLIATELLVGHRLAGPIHLKVGFSYGIAGDIHPFLPMALISLSP